MARARKDIGPSGGHPAVFGPDLPAITRRELFGGLAKAVAVGSVAAAAAGSASALSGCSRDDDSAQVQVLEVEENAIVTLDGFSEIKDPRTHYEATDVAELPYGTKLTASSGAIAAAMCTGETAAPLSTIGLLDLGTGRLNTVLSAAIGQDEGFELYDVACSDRMLVWVESNYLTSDWRVYAAPVTASSLTIGSYTRLDEGDIQFDEPEIACIGDAAYWIVQPAEDGEHTDEDSVLKSSSASGSGGVMHTSHGRFNGGLWTSGNVLVAMPRVDAPGMYYQLTAFENGQVVASQALPRSFRPLDATYMNGRFAFSIPASYDYGAGIANVGTYYPLGETEWLRLTRMPTTPPGLCNGWLFCKSSARTVLVDLKRRRYFTLNPPSGSADYGDYSIATGDVDAIYNYASVADVVDSEKVRTVRVRKIVPRDAG